MLVVITELHTSGTGVTFTLDGLRRELSWTWLRDHARDELSYLHSANQRLVTPSEIAAAGAGRVAVDPTGGAMTVTWPEGPEATFTSDWLASLDARSPASVGAPPPAPWIGSELDERVVPFDYDALVHDDAVLRVALEHLWRDGVVTAIGVPTDAIATRQVVERFGYVRTTIFGELWEFGSDGAYDDTASTPLEITPHTDGTYSHDAPGLLALHCLVYEATGGENVFVDSHAIASRLSPAALDMLSTTDIPGQYIGDGAHLVSSRPALRHVGGQLVQVSYNHHDRAPFVLPEPEMSRLYAALFEFDALANDPALQFELAMRPGDMVLFDNWRALHGRRSFSGTRRIAGGYVNREDVESTTRRLTAL